VVKLKQPVTLETTFGTYTVDELIGEGGAGRVYGGAAQDGVSVAIKLLSRDRATTDRRKRFKNEIAFLARNKHVNIVTVIDHGVAKERSFEGPFYVMPRYDCSLRDLMKQGVPGDQILPLFAKIIDGVEAAHLQGAVHRDLKPENVLFDRKTRTPAVADFGIASFTDDLIVTAIETAPAQRLANFLYAAPEQRTAGRSVGPTADIYALGLILNELFTGNVPHGTEYRLLAGPIRNSSSLM
jgi:serine/threonine protein kinase